MKKYGDDGCGSLAALIAYYGFLSLFPLLLILFTVLGLLFGHDAALQQSVIHSALAQFPVVGKQLARPGGISSLKSTSAAGLAVSVAILLWGSLRVTQAGQEAMADVWNVPRVDRSSYLSRLIRGLSFLGVLVLDLVVSTVLAGFVTSGSPAIWITVVAVAAGLVVNVPLFIVGFRILTPRSVATATLLQGAIVAALGWSLLQYGGAWLVTHELRHASQLYGYFASILGLMAFLYLAAFVTLYAAESNVVRARRLYCFEDAAWGHSCATETGYTLLRWAFESLDLNRVQAETDTRNTASAVPPAATRLSASTNSLTSPTRSLRR